MKKYIPEPGDSWIVINSGIKFTFVRVLIKILFRYPWKQTFDHITKIYHGKTTIEADTKGAKFYNIDKYKKAKRIIVFRHKSYSDKIRSKQYIHTCKVVVAKKWKYGYANYFLWYIGISMAYFFFLPFIPLLLGASWLLSIGILVGLVVLYWPVSRMFKRMQKKSSHCAELAARIDQEYMEINLGVLNYENVYPNFLLAIYSVSWEKLLEFSPNKGEWPIDE